jgi:pyrroloquinoline quinone biosynthesis protein A
LPEFAGSPKQEDCAMWTKPAFTDLRIGFEVTMYFANR